MIAKNLTELPERVLGLRFISGTGDGKETACVMSAAYIVDQLRQGKKIGRMVDSLACVDAPIRTFCIRFNDSPRMWDSDEQRTETLRPLVLEILDTKGSKALTMRRVMRCADFAVHTASPMAFEALGHFDVAEQLRALEAITDAASARRVRYATREIKENAADADAAAAYADAADAAYAAAADAAYADAAAYAAADAADAAAYADAAYADAAAAYAAAAYAKRLAAAGNTQSVELATGQTPAAGDVRARANEQRRHVRDACVALIRELCAMMDEPEAV